MATCTANNVISVSTLNMKCHFACRRDPIVYGIHRWLAVLIPVSRGTLRRAPVFYLVPGNYNEATALQSLPF